MCTGVTKGFAGRKLSGSAKRFGKNKAIIIKVIIKIINPTKSLVV